MTRILRLISLGALVLALRPTSLFCQEMTVSGTVLDEATNEPLAGAVVQVKEIRSAGAVTNASGKFRLLIKAEKATLLVKLVGYKPRAIAVEGSNENLVIKLAEDLLKAEEVLVTGVATGVKRENSPNAIGTISASELLPAPAQTTEQAFAGKVPGLSISQNTGAPGGGISINLRGVSTLVGNSQPLIFVDGVIISNDQIQGGLDALTAATGVGSARPQGQPTNRLADLNPNDIADIQILKGPSAAAVYGAKAAAGVILITTKQGLLGERTAIEVNQQFGFNQLLRKQGTRNWQADTNGFFSAFRRPAPASFEVPYIDYEELLYGQTGFVNETNVSARGGNATTLFYVSGSARNESGIVANTGYRRYATRLTISHRLTNDITIDGSASYVNSASDRGATGNSNNNVSLGYAAAFIPSFIDYRQRGDGTYSDSNRIGSNPFEIIDKVINNERIDRVTASGKLDWDLVRHGNHNLKLVATGGIDFFTQVNQIYSPINTIHERATGLPGRSIRTNTPSQFSNLYASLVHRYQDAGLSFTTSAGVQFENRNSNSVLVFARGLAAESDNINQAASIQQLQTVQKQYDQGIYFQEDVDISGLFFLTAGLRMDRSSANGDVDKFYLFPKGGASVLLSRFGFWDGLRSTVESAKLRVSAGQAGTFAPAVAKFTTLSTNNVGGVSGLSVPARIGNPNIEPERVTEIEFGTDIGFAKGLAFLEFTYYLRNISGLILESQIAASSGSTLQFKNGGEMKTNGIEIALNLNPIRSETFSWNARVNFTRMRAEITKLTVPAFQTGGFGTALGAYTIREGYSPTSIVGSQSFGPNPKAPNPNAAVGQFNGLIIGDEMPDFRMGFANAFAYKGFELYFLWEWKKGGDVINLTRFLTDLGGTTADWGSPAYIERTQRRLGQSPNNPGVRETPWVEDGSFVKLRELTLSYTFSREQTDKLFGGFFTNLKVSFTGRNLLLFTKYTGYDPEVSNFGSIAIGRSIDVTPFPSARTYYFTVGFGL
ncbi:MAG: SusC/RagA family TonB-linked outer membrane protein [Chloroherpetonaceae bacterium]|nr:SusC/RagA family TonB-linked outer membrane protein [Chloroherpetonaceae bacterium]MDW8438471.1 SusC/RagA family TonB-linked outer membrane protein [Chloroherpetonaceae bacterium]